MSYIKLLGFLSLFVLLATEALGQDRPYWSSYDNTNDINELIKQEPSGPKSERESYPTFNMTVILIPEQKCSTVPRGRFKASLINHGFVLFAVNFRKDWDAEQLQEEVLKLFQGKLKEHDKTYFVLASKIVRPGQVYRVSVTIYRSIYPMSVRASIQRNGVELASATQDCKLKIPETLLLKVPPTSVPGIYKLRVEGSVNGVLGGAAFLNETYLEFSQRSMTIFIQTDKPIYMQGQTVRFRAVPVTTELKAFSDAVDVYMLDPNRTIMRRWLSRQTNLGAVSLEYGLSELPVFGNWTIQVVAQGQVEEKMFAVEEYYQTRFEVNVTMPSFFMETNEDIYGSVMANYTSGVPVIGNLTLVAKVESLTNTDRKRYDQTPVIEQTLRLFEGYTEFRFSMRELQRYISRLDRTRVTVTAYVGERYLDMIESGYAQAIIFNSSVKLEFLGSSPQVFKPAMPFKAYIAASYYDGSPLPKWRLNSQRLEIRPSVTYSNGRTRSLEMRREQMTPTEAGIWEMDIDLRSELGKKDLVNDVHSLTIQAFYNDDSGERAMAELLVYAAYAPFDRRIQVSTSTKAPKVGEYIIFHVRSDYYVDKFVYVIISKGIILYVGTEEMSSSIKTFAVSLSPEMAPSSCILVYHVAREGEVVVDSLTFPVDGISRNNFTVALNTRKDKSSDTVEVIINGRPGTYIGLSAVDKSLYEMRSGTELTHAEVLQKMNTFDEYTNGTLGFTWHSREGHADRVVYFPSSTYGIDPNRTFDFAGLLVFTDANVTRRYESCNESDGWVPCLSGQCYRLSKRCDGYKDCGDNSDESNCPKRDEIDMVNFRMYRINRILRLYQSSWLWRDINIGPLGHHIFNVPVPDLPTFWMVSAFGMNAIEGFGLVPRSVPFSSVRPFYMSVEMPEKCKEGEQMGIRISVFNYMSFEIEVTVILAASDDYKFVQVESFGIVTAYGARTSTGEHQHLIWIKPGDTAVVYMPIVPNRLGAINVTLMAKTQVAKDIVTKTVHVYSDGITQYRHTSMVLDLSQGAYLIKYMDTNVTDTPIIPYHQDRRYVFGSNKATVTVSGDVIGPTFPSMPVNASSLLNKPYTCGEPTMFNFAANLHMLRYLRLTAQRKVETEKQAFHFLNIGYQHQLRYQNDDGSFSAFRWFNEPSVWLTAFSARIFHKAAFQEWENFLYIDPSVVSRAVSWLLKYQTREGSFYETALHPFDRKMNGTSKRKYDSVRYRNISLTAFVLITLAECNDLPGELGSKAATARKSAQGYLERMLHVAKDFNDPYELAIVAYALSVSHSSSADEAFNFLDNKMKETSGMRYWSRVQLPPPTTTIENNRPYLLARLPNVDDASNIETTAYGLLVHVNRQAVIQKEIVEWLNTQRLWDGGWASTQDTVIALEALIEYSIQSRLRDVTDVSITVEAPATPGFSKNFHIGEDNLSVKQSLEIPNAWGVIVINAQGSGLALVQLSVEYNVDWLHLMTPPPVPAFDLRVRASFFGRNSSQIHYNVCQRWIRTQESDSSGMSVLEVEIPSGYIVQQQELDAYVGSNKVRNLREARFQERKTTFFFDYLDTNPICVNFKVQRWFPVANLTRYISVKVYDYYAPERYNETMFEVYNLYVLSICHVCGSYQCPYCPAFSWASKLTSINPILLSTCVLIAMYLFTLRRAS